MCPVDPIDLLDIAAVQREFDRVTDLLFVSVEPRRIDVAISCLDRRCDRFDPVVPGQTIRPEAESIFSSPIMPTATPGRILYVPIRTLIWAPFGWYEQYIIPTPHGQTSYLRRTRSLQGIFVQGAMPYRCLRDDIDGFAPEISASDRLRTLETRPKAGSDALAGYVPPGTQIRPAVSPASSCVLCTDPERDRSYRM